MPQPKKRAGASRKPASSSRKPAGASARKPASASARKPAGASARKPAGASARKPAGASAGGRGTRNAAASSAPTPAAEPRRAITLGAVRERLLSSLTLTPERLQEAVDDAVRRGRMTRRDAEELLTTLVATGRQQTEALLSDLEQLIGRTAVRERASRGGDAVLRQVDRARRAAGVPGFPILNYDDLSAAQITARLGDLTPAQLRKVRDYERKHANRKSVVAAVERKLGRSAP